MMVKGQAYTCDLQTGGISANPATISIGQTSEFKFNIFNLGPDPTCIYPIGSMGAIISLPSGPTAPYTFVQVTNPLPASNPYFSYTYNAIDNTVEAVNIRPVPFGEGDVNVAVQVLGVRLGSAQVSDNPNNNTGTAQLVVTAVLPLKLQSFTGQSKACTNTLSWISAEEKNVQTIEIQSSQDGSSFKTVGTVTAKNTAGTNTYSYVDEANLATVYYRLKITDIDGHIIYGNILKLNTACKQPSASVFPNPVNASTNANVILKNFTGKISGQLQDMSGKQLATIKLLNGTNAVNLSSYAQGTYLLKVVDENQATQTLKIITIK